MKKKISWELLTHLEPRLLLLERTILDHAKLHKHDQTYCANNVWYGNWQHRGCKRELLSLVGSFASSKHRTLHSRHAYDFAYEYLYALLPPCKGCACMKLEDL